MKSQILVSDLLIWLKQIDFLVAMMNPNKFAEVSISADGKTLNHYGTVDGQMVETYSAPNRDNRLWLSDEQIASTHYNLEFSGYLRSTDIKISVMDFTEHDKHPIEDLFGGSE